MSGAACKAAICFACIENILDQDTRELGKITIELIAGGNFSDEQLNKFIEIGTILQADINEEREIRAKSEERQIKHEVRAKRAILEVMEL